MMGERQVHQDALFYEFSLERHVPERHLLRSIDRFVELDGLRRELAPFYSAIGRPSIDPELMIRMLIVCYCFGIRSKRRLCEEVHLNLAYRFRGLLGTSEIRVLSRDGTIYAAPTLIYHYMKIHHYKPPEEFIRALYEGLTPSSQEYSDQLRELGLEWNRTSAPAKKPVRFRLAPEPVKGHKE
jgi:transposase